MPAPIMPTARSLLKIILTTVLSPWQRNENFVSRKLHMQQKMHQDPLYRPQATTSRGMGKGPLVLL